MTVLLKVKARCKSSAIDKALDAADILRGLANFLLNYKRTNRTFVGRPTPFNTILPGNIHTMHARGGAMLDDNSVWINTNAAYSQPRRSNSTDPRCIQQRLPLLKRRLIRSPFRDVAEKVILLYTRALDRDALSLAFFELWAALEAGTLSNSMKASSEETIRRASFVTGPPALALQTLRVLRSHRNEYAHRARRPDEPEILVMQLKHYVEVLLRWLIMNPHSFNGIDELIRFLDSPNDIREVDKQIRIMKAARKTLS